MTGRLRIGFAPALFGALAAGVALQGCYVTHSYETVREAPVAGEVQSLAVEVAVVAGEVRIDRAGGAQLYDLDLRYCDSHFRPQITRSDSGSRASLSVGLKRHRSIAQPPSGNERNLLELQLSRETPLDLVLDLGAGRHYAQLGGLRLQSLDVATGSGRVAIEFDRPTADELRLFRADAGPGGLHVGGLGYASPDVMSLSAGGGEFTLDLSGPWDKNGLFQLDVRLGDVTLVLPDKLGLRVVAEGREADDLILPEFIRDERATFFLLASTMQSAALPCAAVEGWGYCG